MLTFSEFIDLLEAQFTRRARVIRQDHPTQQGAELTTHTMPMKAPHREEKVHKIPLHKVTLNEPDKFDGSHSDESEHHIQRVVKDIKAKRSVEPVKVTRGHGGTYHVIDGHHRVEAHLRTGQKHIHAQIVDSDRVRHVDGLD